MLSGREKDKVQKACKSVPSWLLSQPGKGRSGLHSAYTMSLPGRSCSGLMTDFEVGGCWCFQCVHPPPSLGKACWSPWLHYAAALMNVLANPTHKEAWKGWEDGEASQKLSSWFLIKKATKQWFFFQWPLCTVVFYFSFVLLLIAWQHWNKMQTSIKTNIELVYQPYL